MSSITGGGIPSFQAPSFNEANNVLSQIESQVGRVNDLFAEVQSILAQLRSLSPPGKISRNQGESDASWNQRLGAFQNKMQDFQRDLARLNNQLENTYRKLGQAQAKLQKLQGQDLPNAERRDAQRLRDAANKATEALNGAAKAVQGSASAEESSSSKEDVRVELKVMERKIDIRLNDDPSFKDVIHAFALMANIVGVGKTDTPYTQMPSTPGSGIPPIELP